MLRSCECNDAKEPHFYIHFFLSLGEEGALLRLRLATAEGRPFPKPSLAPLHVRSYCTACRSRFGAYALHIFLIYSRRKFANLKTQRRFASAKLCCHLSRRRGWGIVKREGSSFASTLPRLVLALSLRAAKQSVIQAPSPLTKKQDNFRQSFLFLRNLTHSVKFENQI